MLYTKPWELSQLLQRFSTDKKGNFAFLALGNTSLFDVTWSNLCSWWSSVETSPRKIGKTLFFCNFHENGFGNAKKEKMQRIIANPMRHFWRFEVPNGCIKTDVFLAFCYCKSKQLLKTALLNTEFTFTTPRKIWQSVFAEAAHKNGEMRVLSSDGAYVTLRPYFKPRQTEMKRVNRAPEAIALKTIPVIRKESTCQ